TGWADVDLTDKGRKEAKAGGELLKNEGFSFDKAFTSVQKRAIRTLWIALDEMDLMWIPVERSWKLNERFYGSLTGLNKAETAKKFGEDQVLTWRRSYDIPPPELECLKDTVARVVPYFESTIAPEIKEGKKLIIAAHGNSLRALVKYLDDMSEEAILKLNIPTGVPLVYELDENLKPIKHYYLGDQEALAAKLEAVANQGKAK
ncbi:UNVERIFIED_CONTAM: hypothetical protein GTU68_050033, partial [Idotea baltica]|nr:hypothetical protein [Idotea baltica]